MSAEKPNTTSRLSRRDALGGLSVAVAAGAIALPAHAIEAGAADRLDPPAALGRAEFMIERLRTRYVCEGWHGRGLDEDAAARALAYFRNWSAGGPEDADEWMFVVKFLDDHGQSIDWIMLGDPVGMICEGASRSSRASVGDPIFAVIAEHRAAVRAYCAAFDEDDEDLVAETGSDHVDALAELLSSRPTTLRGVVALLEHFGEPDHGHDPEDTVLVGAIGWDGPIKASVNELPRVLAEVMRSLIGGRS